MSLALKTLKSISERRDLPPPPEPPDEDDMPPEPELPDEPQPESPPSEPAASVTPAAPAVLKQEEPKHGLVLNDKQRLGGSRASNFSPLFSEDGVRWRGWQWFSLGPIDGDADSFTLQFGRNYIVSVKGKNLQPVLEAYSLQTAWKLSPHPQPPKKDRFLMLKPKESTEPFIESITITKIEKESSNDEDEG